MRNYYRFIILLFVSVAFSLAQFIIPPFWGSKPNLPLVALVSILFFTADFWESLFFVSLIAFLIKFSPSAEKELLIFSLLALAAVVVKKYLPWHPAVSGLFLISLFTFSLYLFTFPSLILTPLLAKEIFYNLLFGFLLFNALAIFLKRQEL